MKTNSTPRYIDLDFETALVLKYESGKKKHRKNGEASFQGDPSAELYEELLDAIHYVDALEATGAQLPGYRTTLKNMALNLQSRERELRRRI